MALKRWGIASLTLTSLVDGTSNLWTASALGTNEYYYNAGLSQWMTPMRVEIDGSVVAESANALGSLGAGEWAWGDNDTLGEDTIYVRLSDGADPDTKSAGHIAVSQPATLLTAQAAEETVIFSLLFSNYEVFDAATITVQHTDTDGTTTLFEWVIIKAPEESPTAIDSPIVLEPGDKILVTSDMVNVSVLASGEAK